MNGRIWRKRLKVHLITRYFEFQQTKLYCFPFSYVILSRFIVTVQFLFKCYAVNMCDCHTCVINAYLLT